RQLISFVHRDAIAQGTSHEGYRSRGRSENKESRKDRLRCDDGGTANPSRSSPPLDRGRALLDSLQPADLLFYSSVTWSFPAYRIRHVLHHASSTRISDC